MQFGLQDVEVMRVWVPLHVRGAVRKGADKLFWRTLAADGFFKVGKAFHKEQSIHLLAHP